ncbi:hypothetical protein B0H63DRAFT_547624 [Podospora didyma]|uniref:TLC domain-containing protein n=1 Tax=Podospora didyma TaxID=330526 RepID=A0AAE0KJV8_9PEZI|nr:hypothetical protein B0H63DRAFT_547624 [Podospora didyma]
MGAMMATFSRGLDSDIHIASFSFIVTGLLYRFTHEQLERKLPKWDQFAQPLRDRMAVEIACIPVRLGLIFFTLPTVWNAFSPAETWTAADTSNSLFACALMTGAYLFDLIIYREDILSILHHCMGPALLLWTRTCFSTFLPADALVSRSLQMFVFWGAATGGIAATSGVFLLRVGKKYLARRQVHQYFSYCVAFLTITTVLSCYMNVLYFLHTWNQAFAYFGPWIAPLPVIWETFECYLQWRWLLRFYDLEAKLRVPKTSSAAAAASEKDGGNNRLRSASPDSSSDDQMVSASTDPAPIVSLFPAKTVPCIRMLVWQWIVLLGALWFKLIQDSYLSLAGMREVEGSVAAQDVVFNMTG